MHRGQSFIAVGTFILGVVTGGYLFQDTRPRSFLDVPHCANCMHPNEIVGLVAAVGIRHAPGWIPEVVMETDKTIVIKMPMPMAPYHVLLIPKRDIKNIGDAGQAEQPYLVDLLNVAGVLIRQQHLKRYRLWTNSPGNQIMAYLHMHLAGTT